MISLTAAFATAITIIEYLAISLCRLLLGITSLSLLILIPIGVIMITVMGWMITVNGINQVLGRGQFFKASLISSISFLAIASSILIAPLYIGPALSANLPKEFEGVRGLLKYLMDMDPVHKFLLIQNAKALIIALIAFIIDAIGRRVL